MQLTAVIVLYKVNPALAKTIQSLRALRHTNAWTVIEHTHFILYDNSQQQQAVPDELLPDFEYQHSEHNVGLSTAYNYGLDVATAHQSSFLWLLDQDTEVTAAYVDELAAALKHPTQEAVAIVPQIMAAGRIVSPRTLDSPFKVVPVPAGVHRNVLAINSGILVRPAFVKSLGGFSAAFKLDFLDNWLFYQIQQAGQSTFVLHSRLQHELSVMNTQKINMARYQSIIESEWQYYHHYQIIGRGQYIGHMILRIFSQLLIKRDLAKVRFLLQFLLRRKK